MLGKGSVRNRFRFLVILIVIGMMALAGGLMIWLINGIAHRVSREYAHLYNSELEGELSGYLQREIALVSKAAHTNAIIEWAQRENDLVARDEAVDELLQFNRMFRDGNSFIVLDQSKSIYFTDRSTTPAKLLASGHLSRDIPEDIWYFETIDSPTPYNLNIDVDRFLKTMRVWINAKIEDEGEILGAIGTGMYLDPFIKDIFAEHQHKGVKSIIINGYGAIQIDSQLDNIKQNSFAPEASEKKTVFQYCECDKCREAIKLYLAAPADRVLEFDHMTYDYIALSPIENTSWHVVTFFSMNALYSPAIFIPLLVIVFVGVILLAVLLNWAVQRIFVRPFELLVASIRSREAMQETQIYGLERKDEFGLLANSIQQMTERLSKSVPVGMFILSQAGEFLYGNPYFLQQFLVKDIGDFQQLMEQQPNLFFRHRSDYLRFIQLVHQEEEIYGMEAELLRQDESVFWGEIRLSKVATSPGLWRYEGILINTQAKKDYEDQLVNLAMVDKLTGLFNRHHLEHSAQEEISRSERYGHPLTMIIFDLDLFKRVNDTWGHDVGDQVLAGTAALAKTHLRHQDILARWGGEEFAMLLPETSLAQGLQVAEKIRQAVARLEHDFAGIVTASFGVAERGAGGPYLDWFRRVDQALYQAKRSGRNKVVPGHWQPARVAGILHLAWRDSFSSGNTIIDLQHRELFELLNGLMAEQAGQGEKAQLLRLWQQLVQGVKAHFADEERILGEVGYPPEAFAEHQAKHRQLEEEIERLDKAISADEVAIGGVIIPLLDEVVVGHMLQEDVKYYPYTRGAEA